MRGIEYGPSYAPVLPKAQGFNTIVVDHATQEQLISKYSQWNVPTDLIERVDIVLSDDEPIEVQLQSELNGIDYILASHVFEHLPNPMRFLEVSYQLLRPGGILRLAIPDKRFCFDALKPLTTAGGLIQAYVEDRKRHSLGQYFDALSLHCLKDGSLAFPGSTGFDGFRLQNDISDVYQKSISLHQSEQYVDIHAWAFTPSSFKAIMNILERSNLVSLALEEVASDGVYEFFVTLRKTANSHPVGSSYGEGMDQGTVLGEIIDSFKEEQAARSN
ncbi:methyltransferase domain-containing protein [Vulcanococcus limneticus]|uniref:methyltransferase domain-containing protein n=1 Tax=Vulcanococcus limneticus TaxID=2170428 RepID=UPI00398BF856